MALTHEKIMDAAFQREVDRFVDDQVIQQVNEVMEFAMKFDGGIWDSLENLYYEDGTIDCEEGEMKEVFTWYLVKPLLWYRLQAKGCVVAEVLGLKIWGRTTYGQSISMDYEIMEIYEALEFKSRYQS